MSTTKQVFYAIWITMLIGVLVFLGISIHKYVVAEQYVALDDKVYTFSEITGLTAEDEIIKAEWKNLEAYGADRVFQETSSIELQEVKRLLLEMKLVANNVDGKGTTTRMSLYLADGRVVFFSYRNVSNNIATNGEAYAIIGLENYYEVLKLINNEIIVK